MAYVLQFVPSIQKIIIIAAILFTGCTVTREQDIQIEPPEQLYGQLFYYVQKSEIFSDSKTFVDCTPLNQPADIRNKYAKLDDRSEPSLAAFIKDNFILPLQTGNYVTDSASISEHISALWKVLKRKPDKIQSGTLIPLRQDYLVPGGRFREIYYWDSYFTMLGLKADKQYASIENMVSNFSDLINQFGFIPNGNRTYYLSRSQPPFFSLMIALLADIKGPHIYLDHLPQLKKEYAFWMNGVAGLHSPGEALSRVVMLPGGMVLNRYWDAKQTPRPESYREDLKTANEEVRKDPAKRRGEIYRNIRAAAESGWDFSSRWLVKEKNNGFDLGSIHTTDIIPVDLNCLLYHLECAIARSLQLAGKPGEAGLFTSKSEARRKAILKYCWDADAGYFMDFDFKTMHGTGIYSLAGIYPLYFNIATAVQGTLVAGKIEKLFLKAGGLICTVQHTGQQWDAPNGWAPLHWMAIVGLRNYSQQKLAGEIKMRWLKTVNRVYNRTYKLFEKYNVEDLSLEQGGGEYPTQDGFGWTNGVYQALIREQTTLSQEVESE
jgi:alpha,alpha-trehalase